MNWKQASHIAFALTFIGIGGIGFASGTFAPIWQPVPETVPTRELLAYLTSIIALACGIFLLVERTQAVAALILFVFLAVWALAFKAPFVVKAPLVEGSYQSIGENLVLIAAAWVLYTRSRTRIAYVLYGLALIAFGLSHFFYLEMTAPLVPAWLPGPTFWAYATGVIYLGSGILIATGLATRLGALAAAVQIILITLLVWGPMLLKGPLSAMHWQETMVSFALTAGALVLASGPLPARALNRDHFPRRRSAVSDSPR